MHRHIHSLPFIGPVLINNMRKGDIYLITVLCYDFSLYTTVVIVGLTCRLRRWENVRM